MKNNYNEEYEKEINEILKQIKGYGYDYNYLYDEFYNKYIETRYPGYLFYLGVLIKRKFIKSDDENQALSYCVEAAYQNYLPALIALKEVCLNKVELELSVNNIYYRNSERYYNLKSDPYGKYLIAKYNMMSYLCDDDLGYSFQGALDLMQESANEGCEEAIQFMEKCKIK